MVPYIEKAYGTVLMLPPGKLFTLLIYLETGIYEFADGLFYSYNEIGEMGLISATPSSFSVISKFKVPLGTYQHWAHPVIDEGKLYIRHGDALMVYRIRK